MSKTEKACTERGFMEKNDISVSEKENWPPMELYDVPFRLGLVGGLASQLFLFNCREWPCAAATGKHILLEEIKSLTIDRKSPIPNS